MWERTLQDLIRGLRANKHDEARFINQAIDEIRTEARGKDMEVKAAAILKMTFVSSMVLAITACSMVPYIVDTVLTEVV